MWVRPGNEKTAAELRLFSAPMGIRITSPRRRRQFGKEKSHCESDSFCIMGIRITSPRRRRQFGKEKSHCERDSFCAPMGIRTPVWALRGPRPGPLDDGGVLLRRAVLSRTRFPFLESVRDCIIPILNRQRETRALHRVRGRRWCGTFRCHPSVMDR